MSNPSNFIDLTSGNEDESSLRKSPIYTPMCESFCPSESTEPTEDKEESSAKKTTSEPYFNPTEQEGTSKAKGRRVMEECSMARIVKRLDQLDEQFDYPLGDAFDTIEDRFEQLVDDMIELNKANKRMKVEIEDLHLDNGMCKYIL